GIETEPRRCLKPFGWMSSLVRSKQDEAPFFGCSGVKVSNALKRIPSILTILFRKRRAVVLRVYAEVTTAKLCLGNSWQCRRKVAHLLRRLEAHDVIGVCVEKLSRQNNVVQRILATVPGKLTIRQRAVHRVPRFVALSFQIWVLVEIGFLNDFLQMVE